MGEEVLHWRHPMCVSLTIAMQICLHSDHTCAIEAAGVLHSVWSELPHQGNALQSCGHTVLTM